MKKMFNTISHKANPNHNEIAPLDSLLSKTRRGGIKRRRRRRKKRWRGRRNVTANVTKDMEKVESLQTAGEIVK